MLTIKSVNRIMPPRIESEVITDDGSCSREYLTSCRSADTDSGESSVSSTLSTPTKCRDDYPFQSTLVLKIRPSTPSPNRRKSLQADDFLASPYLSSFGLASPMQTIRRVRSSNIIHTEPIRRIVSSGVSSYDMNDVKKNLAEVMGFGGDAATTLRRRHVKPAENVLTEDDRLDTDEENYKRKKNPLLISAESPYKILWDVLTVLISIANVYATHTAVRDREFGGSFRLFCEIWFVIDILLNFVTEYRSGQGLILRDCRSVWARYLTSWFVVDVLSLFPVESLYIQPIIDMQNRRGIFKKSFFRTRAVVRVTRILRGRHFKLFGRAVGHTKHAGVGAFRLLRLLIKYIPKYLLFFRNMKAILALRLLRQAHWFGKIWKYTSRTEAVAEAAPTTTMKIPKSSQDLLVNDQDWEPF